MTEDFLPISAKDLQNQKIEQLDFVYVIGDAYVDHPSFGHAIISRVLDAHGYSVGIISQPDWKDENSVRVLGKPRLGFLVSGGNMDSMVNHYFVSKKKRTTDAYTPGGEMGKRPDHATVVYGNLIRKAYRDTPIIIGGIEASLRRLAHYDYWANQFKRSILLDSQADLISYGMGENSIVEIADALNAGIDVKDISFVPGTVYKTKDITGVVRAITLPGYEQMKENKSKYADSFRIQYENTDACTGKPLIEFYPNGVYVVQNVPQPTLTTEEMDWVYSLPYQRTYHPSYEEKGGVPAITEVKFSLISNRGCFGGCSFCALTFHQGRTIQVRSHDSIIAEAEAIVKDKEFKGYIHDVGGPTANFRHPSCEKQLTKGVCKNKQCLYPSPCQNINADHSDYLSLLRKLRNMSGVKKVFIRSGIRFDYLMAEKNDVFFQELVEHHVSGQLKVAPEHISDVVLAKMGKPQNVVYKRFMEKFKELNQKIGKNQFLVPYLMSSHPGSTIKEAIALAEYLRDLGYMPEQVQDFYPTPSTLSTVMYYTELDPRTMKTVYVCKNPHEKAMQRALIQYRNPKNHELVLEALRAGGREDLIGFEKHCLIRPRRLASEKHYENAMGDKKTKNNKSGKNESGSQNNKNVRNDYGSKNDKSARNDYGSKNDKSARNDSGSRNDKSVRNEYGSRNDKSARNDSGSRNDKSARNDSGSRNDKSARNDYGSRNDKSARNDYGSRNDKSARNDYSSKNDKSARNDSGSRNDKSARNDYGSRNDKSARNDYGSKNDKNARNDYGSKNDKSARNDSGSRNDKSARNDYGSRNDKSTRNDSSSRNDKSARNDYGSRNDKGARNDYGSRNDKNARNDYGSKNDKSARNDYGSRNDKSVRNDYGSKNDKNARNDYSSKNDKSARNDYGSKNDKSARNDYGSKNDKSARNDSGSRNDKSARNDYGSRNDKSARNDYGSRNDKSTRNDSSSRNDKSTRNDYGSKNDKSARNDYSSKNDKSARNDYGSRNDKSARNDYGSRNDKSTRNDYSSKNDKSARNDSGSRNDKSARNDSGSRNDKNARNEYGSRNDKITGNTKSTGAVQITNDTKFKKKPVRNVNKKKR